MGAHNTAFIQVLREWKYLLLLSKVDIIAWVLWQCWFGSRKGMSCKTCFSYSNVFLGGLGPFCSEL